jgi:alkanesulfonate monooxygenase SsuD/methylene tetrahydromethanopterin reductase-like flavin-dependent oxidoreductase (luciferase family)
VGRDPVTLPLSLMATTIVGVDRAEVLARTRAVLRVWGADDGEPEAVLAERSSRWLAGTPAEIADRLGELENAGVERVYLQHLAHADVEMVELIGSQVLPAVAE